MQVHRLVKQKEMPIEISQKFQEIITTLETDLFPFQIAKSTQLLLVVSELPDFTLCWK